MEGICCFEANIETFFLLISMQVVIICYVDS